MARRLPSLNSLRAFEAAGRLGLMKLAAEELHVTHSAISRQIQLLEATLDVRLFEGPKHAPKLSDTGRRLLPALSSAFDQMDVAIRLIADTEEGDLDVSCLGTFLMKWLIPRLQRFKHGHPAINTRVSTADTPVDFSRENFDVAIRVGSGPWPAEADVIDLFPERFGPVYSARLDVEPGHELDLPVLRTQTRRSAWADWSTRSGLDMATGPATEFEHFYFMLEAAVGGLGICIAPWPLVADDIAAGRLVAPFGFIESGQDYVALRRRRKNRKAAAFCNWLQDVAAEFAAAPAGQQDHFAALARETSSISLASK